ncbi:MAG: hypothetical protein ACXV8O_18350 [Methylobacter sp.]
MFQAEEPLSSGSSAAVFQLLSNVVPGIKQLSIFHNRVAKQTAPVAIVGMQAFV